MRLFLDANVVFSAAYGDEGRAQDLIALAGRGRCELFSSAHALDEARRNLVLKAPGHEKRLAGALVRIGVVAEAPAALVDWARRQGLPFKDAPILAAAVLARAEALVTGDARDFGHLYDRTVRGVRVVTLARALALVLGQPKT